MPTDLAQHIQKIPLVDTHEHLEREPEWVENGPDILGDLFGNYVSTDLVTAGASPQGLNRLMDGNDPGQIEADTGVVVTEKRAISIADRIMRDNQFDCFDVSGTRSNIRAVA